MTASPPPNKWMRWAEALAVIQGCDSSEVAEISEILDSPSPRNNAAATALICCGDGAGAELLALIRTGEWEAEGRRQFSQRPEVIEPKTFDLCAVGVDGQHFVLRPRESSGPPWFVDFRVRLRMLTDELPSDVSLIALEDVQASSAINADKPLADEVAKLLRARGGKVQQHLNAVAETGTRVRSLQSTHAGIRKSLNYYYDKLGHAKK